MSRDRVRRLVLVLAVAAATWCPGSAEAADPVGDAIDRGIEYLLGRVQAKPNEVEGVNGIGQTALETYALVVAGISIENPAIRENFEYLHKSLKNLEHTYSLACYIFALDAAIAQVESDLLVLAPAKVKEAFRDDPRIGKELRPFLASAVQQLARLQTDKGGWDYGKPGARFDNSNTQFAVLGLGVGAKRGVPIEPQVWRQIMEHFVKGQQAQGPETNDRIQLLKPSEKAERVEGVKLVADSSDRKGPDGKDSPGQEGSGKSARAAKTIVPVAPANPEVGTEHIKVYRRGWDYENKGGATWNMTCAGLSSLILARQQLKGHVTPKEQEALNAAIRDGYGWVMGNWSPTASFYSVYSVEKVGDLGEVKLLGVHDWYRVISEFLTGDQRPDGSWPDGRSHGENARVSTAFALLVLNRATSLLTRNPATQILVSGRGGAKDPNDRSWVYVSSIDTSIHYSSLLRQIRLRPKPKLVQFLKEIVESYPVEWKGELIPDMAQIRDDIPHKPTQKIIEGYLELITGCRYKDYQDYLKWHRRWERVVKIGSEQRKDQVPDLLKYYTNTQKSTPLRQTVIWALQQCKAREALPLFLEDLKSPDEVTRGSAYAAFRSFFVDFPPRFDAAAADAQRAAQVTAIEAWYAENEKKP